MEKAVISCADPAGLSAAITLAKAGYDVEVFEENKDIGKRFHGTLQGLENWSENKDALEKFKKMKIAVDFDYYPFSNLSISNGKNKWDLSCNKPAFYLIKRGSTTGCLDHSLKEQALNSGVNIRFGEIISEAQTGIVATGPLKQEKFAAAKEIVFKTDHENMAIGLVNNIAAIKGYSYLLVADGCATMCSVLFDRFEI